MNARPLLLLLLLLLPQLPLSAAAPSATPGEDGVWRLGFDVVRERAGSAEALLDVAREDADGVARAERRLGELTFPAGPSRHEVDFLPAEGPGRYTVTLRLDGERQGSVSFDVEEAGVTARVAFEVADAPTHLNLTNEDVNADGKTKSPGEALVTRATLADANGVAELDGVAWSIESGGAVLDAGSLAPSAAAGATSATIELRYDRAPLAAGTHTLHLRAQKDGSVVAHASRTFVIRDVAPTFLAGALPHATPDEDLVLRGSVLLADKNGALGPAEPEARVYRGSTRAEGAGFAATLGAPARLADENGTARWSLPLELRVPARAAPGTLRVSLYHDGTLLGAVPFDVLPLPTLRSVAASTQGGRLVLAVNASGEGVLTARLTDGDGAATSASRPAGLAEIALDPPARGRELRWTLALRARADGPVLAERNGTWSAPFDGPALALDPVQARRLPAAWTLRAGGWDAEAAEASFSFTRWDGEPESALSGTLRDGRVRVDSARELAPGRYHARLILTWANGSASEATWSFDAGAWVELALGEPRVSERTARVPLQNVGGLAVARLVVEAEPAAQLKLVAGNATHAPRVTGGRAVFTGLSFAPGETAEVLVQLPEGPLASGRRVVEVRVLARVGA